MPVYVLLSKLTAEGRQTVTRKPERLEQVNLEVRDFGCKILAQYALMGGYDFLTLLEAPDNETVIHLSVSLGSRGTVEITTLPALPVDEFLKTLRGPNALGKK